MSGMGYFLEALRLEAGILRRRHVGQSVAKTRLQASSDAAVGWRLACVPRLCEYRRVIGVRYVQKKRPAQTRP